MAAFLLLTVALLSRGIIATPILKVAETGASAQFRSQDNLGNYNFGYNEDHTSGGTFRHEAGNAHGNVAGSYGLRDADGRIRIVNYIANEDGFHADIKTNEPGVEPKDTAGATFNKAKSVVVQTATAPASVVAVPAADPVVYKTEQVPVPAPVFPPYPDISTIKSVAQPITYVFPEPASVPVSKSHITSSTIAEASPVTYAFPTPAAVPVDKSIAAPAPIIPEPAPLTLVATRIAFLVLAVVPVPKSNTTYYPSTPYSTFGRVRSPALPERIILQDPIGYSAHADVSVPRYNTTYYPVSGTLFPFARFMFPPIPSQLKRGQVMYIFSVPAITAPVAVVPAAPLPYAYPASTSIPVAKSTTVQYAAPITPTPLTYAAPPVAVDPLTYAAPPTSKLSYTNEVRNVGPATYAVSAPGAVAYTPGQRYTINPRLSGLRYANSYYKSLHSPVVASFAGAVPYFNNIEYRGYPVVKK